MNSSKSFEDFLEKNIEHSQPLLLLRELFLSQDLQETIKWGIPVYTYKGKNMVGMAVFKSYFAIWFYQGSLLNDEYNKLINAQEGKTKSLRQWRFSTLEDLKNDSNKIIEYIQEAIINQEKGIEVKPQRNTKPLVIPPQLQEQLDANKSLNVNFEAFSLSKRREFADYITEAKREATKQTRLEKIIPLILEGIGLNDKYKK